MAAMSQGKPSAQGGVDAAPTFRATQPLGEASPPSSRDRTAGEILRTLAKVNRVVLQENDRVAMLDAICKILVEHPDYIYAWVGLTRQTPGDVFLAAASGPTCDFLENFSLSTDGPSDLGPLCAVQAIRNAAPFLIDGSEHEDPCPDCPTRKEYPERTTLALPLIRDERSYGVFVVHATGPGIFDQQEQALLADLADNIAYALEKLEADERGKNHLEEVMLLNEITRVALESTTIGEALEHLAVQLQGALKADQCDLALWNTQRQEITSVASTAQDGDDSPRICPQSEGVAAVLAANRPVPCGQGCVPIPAPGPTGPFIMGMPLVAHDTPLGAAFVTFDDERPSVQCDLNRARTITGHIALAIAHTTTVEANARRIKALLALHETAVDLAGHHDIKALLRTIVIRAGKLVGTEMGGLYLTVPNGLQMVVARGMLEPFVDQVLPAGQGASGRAVVSRKAILINDYATWKGSSPMYADIQVGSVIAAPLLWKDQVLGAFHVEHPSPNAFGPDDIEIVSLFAEQAAVAIANARLIYNTETARKELELGYTATLEGWVRALDLRDQETEGHTQRVTDLTVELARRMDVAEDQLEPIRRGALLHDIGKIGIPDAILRKPGPLTEDEWTIMRRHPQMAWDMLSPIEYLRTALAIPYGHHERWDGSGYPLGTKGRQIPQAARIFSVVDVYDALRSNRPYRDGWPEEQVIDYIKERSGVSFDPEIIDAFLDMMSER
jgi:GAF domain-containing protein